MQVILLIVFAHSTTNYLYHLVNSIFLIYSIAQITWVYGSLVSQAKTENDHYLDNMYYSTASLPWEDNSDLCLKNGRGKPHRNAIDCWQFMLTEMMIKLFFKIFFADIWNAVSQPSSIVYCVKRGTEVNYSGRGFRSRCLSSQVYKLWILFKLKTAYILFL